MAEGYTLPVWVAAAARAALLALQGQPFAADQPLDLVQPAEIRPVPVVAAALDAGAGSLTEAVRAALAGTGSGPVFGALAGGYQVLLDALLAHTGAHWVQAPVRHITAADLGWHLHDDTGRTWPADAVVLALGGGSWSRLGSDGAWVPWLQQQGVSVAPLRPSNCGFDVAGWSRHFSSRFAGQPFKSVAIALTDSLGGEFTRRGEFVATETGLEGSLIYAASSWLREEISRSGSATLRLDLLPDKSAAQVLADVSHPRGSRSLSSHLKSRLGLEGIKAAILHELLDKSVMADAAILAMAIKALPVTLVRARPLDEAISSAGGVRFSDLSADLQVQGLTTAQAVFCAGEMLDWEAPTGGYLMTACMASGRRAGQGVLRHLGLLSAA